MKIPLTSGAYQARSIIAEAQACINLFPESNPQDAPFPVTHYPTPGLVYLAQGNASQVRCLWKAQTGAQFAVIGNTVYTVDSSWALTSIGTILTSSGIVSIVDNGLAAVLVDGTANGYAIDLSDNEFGDIVSPAFYGANRADYVDTFFLFNRPATNEWYISLSEVTFGMLTNTAAASGSITAGGTLYTSGVYTNVPLTGGSGSGATANLTITGGVVVAVTLGDEGKDYIVGDMLSASPAVIGPGSGFVWTVSTLDVAFDPLDIAAKVGAADNLSTLAAVHREIWLIGTDVSSEVWYNSGAADFTFQEIPGAFMQQGNIATYSLGTFDLNLFWLSQDRQGKCIVMQGTGYSVKRISTHPIEKEFSSYATVSDAVGFCYMQEGHAFYFLTFPTADTTWCYDVSEGQWHQRAWIDTDGNFHRHRANCTAVFNNVVVVGDYENGTIYEFDLDTYTDNGNPIPRVRSFPHFVNEMDRINTRALTADMAVGNDIDTADGDSPTVSLRWSDTRGASWGNAITQSLGQPGQYLASPQWNRLGLARDRVYELSWSAPMKTALNGIWIDVIEMAS